MESPTAPTDLRPVSAWNIFWTLLTLSLSCAMHPAGSHCGFPARFKIAVRMNPFSTCFDSLLLVREVLVCRASRSHGWRAAVHRAVVQRLDDTPGDVRAKNLEVAPADTHVRRVVSALCVVQYVKTWGYTGVPSFIWISSAFFASWISMEVLFRIAMAHTSLHPRRPVLSPTPLPSSELHPGPWAFVPLAVVLVTLSPIPVAALFAATCASAVQLILVWHGCVLWLPLLLVSSAPEFLTTSPDPTTGIVKALAKVYGMMIGGLVLVVVYWVVAIVGLGLVVVPLYLAVSAAVPLVRRAAGWCGSAVVNVSRGAARVVPGVVVAVGGAWLWMLFVPEGTSKGRWTGWIP